MDYITSRDKTCHGKSSVSLGNGLEEAQMVEAVFSISASRACPVRTTGLVEELRGLMDCLI